jgi:hypothetical protein
MTDAERLSAIIVNAIRNLPKQALCGTVMFHMSITSCLVALGRVKVPVGDPLPPVIIGEVGGIPVALDDSLGKFAVRISWAEQTSHALTYDDCKEEM